MKKSIFTLSFSLVQIFAFSQYSGNENYKNLNYNNQTFQAQNFINIPNPNPNQILIDVKGLANVKADSYVAIFSVTQVGKDQEETNKMIDERINNALKEINANKGVESFIDVISFVPKYEFEAEKKVFSRKTYNEIPIGFEIKKNVHLKFSDANQLQNFVQIFSKNEIYDLVRVDYFAENLENIKKELANKARLLVQEKMKNYEIILGENFVNDDKSLSEDYKVLFPVEMYKSYEASNSASLNLTKSANVNSANKNITIYYQPIFNKDFDVVINPIINEPVIQIMYEMKVLITKKSKTTNKEYLIITTNGEVKNLNLKN